MAEHMTFNHGVRSSTLRWVTKKKSACKMHALFCLVTPLASRVELCKCLHLPRTCGSTNYNIAPHEPARLSSDSPMGICSSFSISAIQIVSNRPQKPPSAESVYLACAEGGF